MNPHPDDSWPLCVLAQQGDRAAFERLVRQHQSGLRMQLRRLSGGDTALADDLAQESLLVAWRQLPQFRGEARFATWLYRIAYHQYLMQRRQDSPAAPPRSPDTLPAEEAIDPLTQEHRDLSRDLQVALDELTTPERVAIVHCYFLDLSHDEAAQVLGIPLGTLKSHVQRGKEKLRHRMSAWQGESSL